MFKRDELIAVLESIRVTKGDTVWIHHPITQDLMTVVVKRGTADKILASVPEGSPYFGQPDFYMKKINIVGIKK
jgi:hypothetical protein